MEQPIDKIRNILRKEGITGMNSIEHCIIFVIARMLNDNLCEKTNIDKKYTYNNLIIDEDGDRIKGQELFDKIYTEGNVDCLVGQIIKKIKYTNIKFNNKMSTSSVEEIMKILEKIDFEHLSIKYDIIGTIYELHLKSGTSNAMRDLGQYYTNRQVINYMIKLCDPIMNKKGQIETISDPTMGTGGFLTMSVKYLNEKYKNKVDWSKNKNNLIGFDIDDNVKNMAMLNMFLETGELCNETLIKNDTLYNDFKISSDKTIEKVDVILANEPMGLSGIIHANCCEKVKELKIRGTKAEPLFMQLFMQSLNDGGRCAVIVPDGMLFNDSNLHTDTRKHLIENFDLKKVVALSDDFFLNTGVKTSILYFVKNGNKTSEVEFSSIKLNKGELEETSIIKVSYDDIKLNGYSLFVNKYNVQEVTKVEGIEYKKLNDVCIFKSGKQISKEKFEKGDYPVIGGGCNPTGYHNEYNRDENTILCSSSGANAGFISKYATKIWASDCFSIHSKNGETLDELYLFHFLKNIQKQIYECQTGSAQPHIYSKSIENIEIPIPSIEVQQMIVKQLDLLSENNASCKKQIDEFRQILKDYVKCMTLWDEEKEVRNVINFIKTGKNKPSDNKTGSLYPYYGTSGINGYTDEFLFDGNYLLTPRNGTIGVFFKSSGKIFPSDHIFVLEIKDNYLKDYFYYYMVNCLNLDQKKHGSTIMGVTRTDIEESKIKVPSLEKQKEIVAYCDEIEETIKLLEKRITSNEQLMKQILDTYLKVREQVNEEEVNNVIGVKVNEQIDEPVEIIAEEKPKKKVIVKKVIKKNPLCSKVESNDDI